MLRRRSTLHKPASAMLIITTLDGSGTAAAGVLDAARLSTRRPLNDECWPFVQATPKSPVYPGSQTMYLCQWKECTAQSADTPSRYICLPHPQRSIAARLCRTPSGSMRRISQCCNRCTLSCRRTCRTPAPRWSCGSLVGAFRSAKRAMIEGPPC